MVRSAQNWSAAVDITAAGDVAVMVAPTLPTGDLTLVVDARLAKEPLDCLIDDAAFVVGLGPGYVAGTHCDAVIETMRGHHLGRVIWSGSAMPNTGVPGIVGGKGAERVVRSPVSGHVDWKVAIGDRVTRGQPICTVGGFDVEATIDGVVRGAIAPGFAATAGLKIGDIDPRCDRSACFEISDKALAVGGGVVEAVGRWSQSR